MTHSTLTTLAHTPGPWFLDGADLIVYDSKRRTAAMIATLEPRDTIDEWSANAQLVSTAPELLDACWIQLNNWRKLRDGEWNSSAKGIQIAIEALESVIAGATGRDPRHLPSRIKSN